jgi:hypothetical protein
MNVVWNSNKTSEEPWESREESRVVAVEGGISAPSRVGVVMFVLAGLEGGGVGTEAGVVVLVVFLLVSRLLLLVLGLLAVLSLASGQLFFQSLYAFLQSVYPLFDLLDRSCRGLVFVSATLLLLDFFDPLPDSLHFIFRIVFHSFYLATDHIIDELFEFMQFLLNFAVSPLCVLDLLVELGKLATGLLQGLLEVANTIQLVLQALEVLNKSTVVLGIDKFLDICISGRGGYFFFEFI